MTFDEIKGLHEMGFSNEEIMKLSTVSTGNPQPEPNPEPQPDPQPTPQPEHDEVSQLRDEVKQLREQLQQSNRQNMFVNSVTDDLQTQTDKIMAELIRPSIKEDKKQ